jgi:hypothetical protein
MQHFTLAGSLLRASNGQSGNRCTSARIISNEGLPEPITMDARNSMVGISELRRMSATS